MSKFSRIIISFVLLLCMSYSLNSLSFSQKNSNYSYSNKQQKQEVTTENKANDNDKPEKDNDKPEKDNHKPENDNDSDFEDEKLRFFTNIDNLYNKFRRLKTLNAFELYQNNYVFKKELATDNNILNYKSINEQILKVSKIFDNVAVGYNDNEKIAFEVFTKNDEDELEIRALADMLYSICQIRHKLDNNLL